MDLNSKTSWVSHMQISIRRRIRGRVPRTCIANLGTYNFTHLVGLTCFLEARFNQGRVWKDQSVLAKNDFDVGDGAW